MDHLSRKVYQSELYNFCVAHLRHIAKAQRHLFVAVQDTASLPFAVCKASFFQPQDINSRVLSGLRTEGHGAGSSDDQEMSFTKFKHNAGAKRLPGLLRIVSDRDTFR